VNGKLLLLGLGNDILCDDAVGLRVAEAVRERLVGRTNVAVIQSAEMGLALLDLIVGFDTLLIVDAVQTSQAKPGFVHEIGGDDLKSLAVISPHFLGVGEAIALGKELGLHVPGRVKIFAVEVQDPFTVGTQMTPAMEEALPQIIERVMREVSHLSVSPATS
jgi:hydrogenase maturation protease